MTAARALLTASHPGPSLVVTAVVVGLGVAARLPAARLVVLAVAIVAGQVSIGWANDWIDGRAGRDAGRADKPVATGAVTIGAVRTAALVAVAVCVVASLALGVIPAAWHLLAVAGGWAYDLWLKATWWSVVPYAVSFGLLPVIVAATAEMVPGAALAPLTAGLPAAGISGSPWWAVLTAASFGAGIHFANALPDLAQDAATGVRGLPQRLGARSSVVAAAVLLAGGAAVALTAGAAADGRTATGLVLAALAVALVGGTLVLGLRGAAELAYRCAMAAGLLVVGVLVLNGAALA